MALSACTRDSAENVDEAPDAAQQWIQPGFFNEPAMQEPVAGGTLTLADYAESRSLDPTKNFPTGYSGGTPLVAIYDQLIRWNEREQTFEPRLAEAIEPNADYTEWTITLRPDVTFSDGSPLDADAVVGSFNYYFDNYGFDLGIVAPLWAGASKIDDRTVAVSLRESWATFPAMLGTGLGFIVAPAAIADGPDGFTPIGAGPFTLETYKPSEELVLVRNAEYWDGAPYLDELRFVWLGADVTKFESFETSAVDAAVIRDGKTIQAAMENETPGWVRIESLGNIIHIHHGEQRPGSSKKVRLAMAHAIDEKALNDRVFDGFGLPTRHLFGPESEWHNPDATVVEHNPELASELVAEAKAEGFDGTLTILSSGDPISRDQGLTLQAQLEAVGFEVENEFIRTAADLTNRVYVEGDFDFARSALSISDTDPYSRLYENYYSTAMTNTASYGNQELDVLIDELRGLEGGARRDVLQRIENTFLEDLPSINLASTPTFVIWSDDVQGIIPTNEAMLSFEKAWVAS